MRFALTIALAATAAAAPAGLETARDQQDRAVLQQMVDAVAAAAEKAPNDHAAQYSLALACSYLAEVMIEQRERKPARQVAEQGIKAGEKAVALKPQSADYHRVLGTLYGQAITDVMSGLSYGRRPRARSPRPWSWRRSRPMVWVAHGVGNYYLPAALGGGAPQRHRDLPQGHRARPEERRGVHVARGQPAQGQQGRRGAAGVHEVARAEPEPRLGETAARKDAGQMKPALGRGRGRRAGAR